MIGLAAGGVVSPTVAAQVMAAVNQLPSVSQQIVAELSSTDSDIVRAQKITEWTAPVLAQIDALPPTAKMYANAVLMAWRAFLAFYPVPTPSMMLRADRHSTKYDAKRLDEIRDEVFSLTDNAGKVRP